jgi:hypothetical protein
MDISFPGESAEYRAARDRLLESPCPSCTALQLAYAGLV